MSSVNEIENDKITSTLIKVETLQKEYDVILQQYQESGKNYIASLESNTSSFVALNGRTWWGIGSLTEGHVTSQKECENMCMNSSKCSGATFNPVKKYCWARTGESKLTPGLDNDYALITEQYAALSTMQYLNEKLLELNRDIGELLQSIYPEVKEEYDEKNKKQKELNKSYDNLIEQKIEIDKQLREYESINKEDNNEMLYVTQQNVSYKLWVLITCLVLLVMCHQLFGQQWSISIWLIMIIILIVLTYSLSGPSGFFIWCLLLVGIVVIKMSV